MKEQIINFPPKIENEETPLLNQQEEPIVSKKRVAVNLTSNFYLFYVILHLIESSDVTLPQRQFIYNYMDIPFCLYMIISLVTSIIPHIILACKNTPKQDYPVLKNGIESKTQVSRTKFALSHIHNSVSYNIYLYYCIILIIYPVLYWYNHGQASVTYYTMAISSLYLAACYFMCREASMVITTSYRAVSDIFTIWKFAIHPSRSAEEAVQV